MGPPMCAMMLRGRKTTQYKQIAADAFTVAWLRLVLEHFGTTKVKVSYKFMMEIRIKLSFS